MLYNKKLDVLKKECEIRKNLKLQINEIKNEIYEKEAILDNVYNSAPLDTNLFIDTVYERNIYYNKLQKLLFQMKKRPNLVKVFLETLKQK